MAFIDVLSSAIEGADVILLTPLIRFSTDKTPGIGAPRTLCIESVVTPRRVVGADRMYVAARPEQ